jgi:hypothetical protein
MDDQVSDQVSGKKRKEPVRKSQWKLWTFETNDAAVAEVLASESSNPKDAWFIVAGDTIKGVVSFPNGRQEGSISKWLDWKVKKLEDKFKDTVQHYSRMSGEKIERNAQWLLGNASNDAPVREPRALSQIKEEQFYPYQRKAYELFKSEPDGRSVHWFHELEGNKGKSAFVTYLWDNHPDEVLIFDKGKFEDLAHTITSTDMTFVRAIVWDVPRQNKGHISTTMVECVLNGRVRSTKYQGKFIRFAPVHVITFSNFGPTFDSDELSSDRLKMYEIVNGDVDMENPKGMSTTAFSSTSQPLYG